MKKVLVLVFSNLKHDARVNRQINWLQKNHLVTVVCFDSQDISNVQIVRIKQTKLSLFRKSLLAAALLLKQYKIAYRLFHSYNYLIPELRKQRFDLIVANDIDTLPLAFKISENSKIIFDAHEYAPRHFENNKTWKFFFQSFYISLCQEFIPRVHGMFTVSQGLASEYEKNFDVKPTVLTNATRLYSLSPSDVVDGKIRLIHHGIANKSRQLELMIEMMRFLDERFSLDMILMTSDYASGGTKQYIQTLKASVSSDPRIRILPGVESHQVVPTIHTYDIGVFLIPPVNFNYANTLPNKLFDFIQARLGVAIGPTPEMAAIVNKYKNGVVSEDFNSQALARKLNALRHEDVVTLKQNSANAAIELNAERNEEILNTVVQKTLGS
jgi:hypothetical protein